jgi:hypothetical protein
MSRTPRSYCAALVGVVAACSTAAAGGAPDHAQTQPANTAGVRAYIDPETGEPGVPPPGVVVAPSVQTSGRRAVPLVEVPSTGPAGGVMVNAKGRLRADVLATTDASGKTTARCEGQTSDRPAGADRHE